MLLIVKNLVPHYEEDLDLDLHWIIQFIVPIRSRSSEESSLQNKDHLLCMTGE